MVTRAAIYARISRDDQGDSAGVARQEADCRSLCKRRGWEVVELLVDNDVSAYSGRRRPGYERLKELIRAGAVDAVIAWAPERLQRSPRELEDFIDLVEAQSIQVETVKAGTWDVSSSHGRLVARMLGAVSRSESERIGERVSRAHEQIREEGRWLGACPYGMRRTAASGVLEVDETQATTVRYIADRIIKGDALTRIAADLNASGSRPRRGKAWSHTGIMRLISSPALGGMHVVDGELRPAKFEGPLSEEEWRVAQAALATRPRGESRRPREQLTLLGGIMKCHIHEQPVFGGGTDYSRTYSAAAPGICHVTIGREPVDRFIEEVVVARLRRDDAAEILLPPPRDERSDLEAEALRVRRSEIVTLVTDGLIPPAEARRQLERIAEQLSAADASARTGPVTLAALADPQMAWDSWTMPQRRAAIETLFESVEVTHLSKAQGPKVDLSRIKVRWKRPPTTR